MAKKTKREYILATCFLTGAAAIISLVSLGTQEWVTSGTLSKTSNQSYKEDSSTFQFGLFGGTFEQGVAVESNIPLTMVCLFDKNACALLCGANMMDNLEKLYNNENATQADVEQCTSSAKKQLQRRFRSEEPAEKVFINAGLWLCTILFLCLSALIGIITAGLAVWNTAASPYQVYFSIFGLYIYNGIASCTLLLAMILWGALYAQNLKDNEIPTYKTFTGEFQTKGKAVLGYSYWINLISVIFYLISIGLLYLRNYLISKEPEVNVHIEENADPVIYLY